MSQSSRPNASADAESRVFPATVVIPGPDGRARASAPVPATPALRSFRFGQTPVTNREFAPFLKTGRVAPPPWWMDSRFSRPNQPVVGVSWSDAVAFCVWLTEGAAQTWRLPTVEEWEWAACGGLLAPRTPWGEDLPAQEIPEGPLDGPWDTGRGTPNGYGVQDPGTMVHEWCSNLAAANPPASGPRRASKGGSWRHAVRWSPPSAASSLMPEARYADYGFRVLREEP